MDYLSLITPEHKGQPKFTAWLNAALGMIIDAQNFLAELYLYYDIDNAIGTQLDSIGVMLDIPRKLPFTPSNGVSPVMDDTNYRMILKAKVTEAHFNGTITDMYSLFETALENTDLYFDITDNQDMTCSILAYGNVSSLIQDEIEYGMIVPRPQGVGLNTNVTSNKVFAWGLDNEIYGGWNTGYWLIRKGV